MSAAAREPHTDRGLILRHWAESCAWIAAEQDHLIRLSRALSGNRLLDAIRRNVEDRAVATGFTSDDEMSAE